MKQVQDYYFKKAKKDKFVARSIYKLEEMNNKHKFIKKGDKVLDLGCFPGSWLQYIYRQVGEKGLAVGVDRTELKIKLPENAHFIHSDINELDMEILGDYTTSFDVVASDMAPNTTGIRSVDQERSIQLCQMALLAADKWLRKGGACVVKVLEGAALERLLKQMREEYTKVYRLKPKSSRNESTEIFVLGLGKKNAQPERGE